MSDIIRSYSGRDFTAEDIEQIKWIRKNYPKLSFNEFAATVCEVIGWVTTTGRPKSVPCQSFLKILAEEKIIELPPIKKRPAGKKTDKTKNTYKNTYKVEVNDTEINCKLSALKPLSLEIAYAGEGLKKWRYYIDKYHMQGYKMVFGSRLHYFIKSGDRELGCLQFSASAWALEERDDWIGWNIDDKTKRLHLILNNSRFLIFPWVKVKYLASASLGMVVKQIKRDWLNEYCYEPVLLETFVNMDHYQGTCYKAANWIRMGETKGRGRMDRYFDADLPQKAIFLYPLEKDFRDYLTGEKEYKRRDPDEF